MLLKKLFGLNFKVSIKSQVGQRNSADEVVICVQEKQLWLSNSSHSQRSLWVLQITYSEVWTKPGVLEHSPPPPGASPQLFLFNWWLLRLFKNSLPYLPHLSSLFSPHTLGCWASRETELLGQSWFSCRVRWRSGLDKPEGVRDKGGTSEGTGILPCPAAAATTHLGLPSKNESRAAWAG